MKWKIIKFVNPWLYRCQFKLDIANAKLLLKDKTISRENQNRIERFDEFVAKLNDATVLNSRLQNDLDESRKLVDALIKEKQELANEYAKLQQIKNVTVDEVRAELDGLRTEHRKKLDEMSMLKRQLARIGVWILRTHRVDLSSFLGVNESDKLEVIG
jgi:hypothetical protein